MKRARNRARRLGFDPDRWFGNVEIGMYRAVSGEPASYVRNIYKYYVTYQGLEKTRQARDNALERQPGKNPWAEIMADGNAWVFSILALCLLGALVFWTRKRS